MTGDLVPRAACLPVRKPSRLARADKLPVAQPSTQPWRSTRGLSPIGPSSTKQPRLGCYSTCSYSRNQQTRTGHAPDSEWKALLDSPKRPPQPAWLRPVTPGEEKEKGE